jgi:hypothetical protein
MSSYKDMVSTGPIPTTFCRQCTEEKEILYSLEEVKLEFYS